MMKRINTPRGPVFERRRTPPPRAIVSAGKGVGTSLLTLIGIALPTVLMWLMDSAHVTTVLSAFPISPSLAAIIVALVTGIAKFAWDYTSRTVKHKRGR
jgi:glycerol-3-phosphate acyltransferase PlsY